jgi:excisionase family DNA binding protein
MMRTVTEAATMLDLSEKRIYRLIADGRIAKQEQFGRILISDTELRRFQKLPRRNGRPWPQTAQHVNRKSTSNGRAGRKGGK